MIAAETEIYPWTVWNSSGKATGEHGPCIWQEPLLLAGFGAKRRDVSAAYGFPMPTLWRRRLPALLSGILTKTGVFGIWQLP